MLFILELDQFDLENAVHRLRKGQALFLNPVDFGALFVPEIQWILTVPDQFARLTGAVAPSATSNAWAAFPGASP